MTSKSKKKKINFTNYKKNSTIKRKLSKKLNYNYKINLKKSSNKPRKIPNCTSRSSQRRMKNSRR